MCAVVRLLLSIGTIVASLVLGALMMAFAAVFTPDTLSVLMDWARGLAQLITGTGLAAKYNVWLRFLLEGNQLVMMFFTVFARILLWLVAYPFVLLRERT